MHGLKRTTLGYRTSPLTGLALYNVEDIPPIVSQLTALRMLEVINATPEALNSLHALPHLSKMIVEMTSLTPSSVPLQAPALQCLELTGDVSWPDDSGFGMAISFLIGCKELRTLQVCYLSLHKPSSLAANSMLQHLELEHCSFIADDSSSSAAPWQQMFAGRGQLPHLMSLRLSYVEPALQTADLECVAECCSNLRELHLSRATQDPLKLSGSLVTLPALTCLKIAPFVQVCAEDYHTLEQMAAQRRMCIWINC